MLILLSYEQEIRQNVYLQPNHIRSIFGPYSLPIDSDSVFVSAHYPLRFRIRKKYGNEYGFTSIRPYPLRFHPYLLLSNKPLLKRVMNRCSKGSSRRMITIGLWSLSQQYNCYKSYSNIKTCNLINLYATCKVSE
jgi:hypothetical protein